MNNLFLLLTECSIWSSSDTSDVMSDDHFTEYSMTSEHHRDITVQTEAECHSDQVRLNLKNKTENLRRCAGIGGFIILVN